MKFMNLSNFIAIALVLLITLFGHQIFGQNTYYPPTDGSGWEEMNPEELNWCADSIASLYEWLEEKNTKAFIVLQDGKIVLEEYFGAFQPDSVWLWASAGKTLTSFMMGQAQEDDLLRIDDPMSDYLGRGWTSLSPEREDSITIFHGLTMTSGLDESIDEFCTDPECLQYLAPPGTRWAYHNGPYTSLLGVLEEAYGFGINIMTNRLVKEETGMDGFWLPIGYNRIYFSTARSMARFGWLIANDGRWENEALLEDTQYLEDMRRPSQEFNPSYGYLWWLNGQDAIMLPGDRTRYQGPMTPEAPADAYFAIGASSQIIAIHPTANRVIIRMGQDPGQSGPLVPTSFLNDLHERINRLSCGTVAVDQAAIGEVQLFPVPAQNRLYWTTDTSWEKMEIHSFQGQKVTFTPADFNRGYLPIEKLPKGTYLWVGYRFNALPVTQIFIKL